MRKVSATMKTQVRKLIIGGGYDRSHNRPVSMPERRVRSALIHKIELDKDILHLSRFNMNPRCSQSSDL
jgi:hypothetical protein